MIARILIFISLMIGVITARTTWHLFRHSIPSRHPTHSYQPISSHVTPARPIDTCQLNSPSCSELYNCVHHSYPLHIYTDQLIRLYTFKANDPHEGYCVPVKKRKCNPFTGNTVVIKINQHYDTVCMCKYPHLVTKHHLFDACTVDVACGDGHLSAPPVTYDPFLQGSCICPTDSMASIDPTLGPICKKMTTSDRLKIFCSGGHTPSRHHCVCDTGYMKVSPTDPEFIHPSFRQHLSTTICVKNPCLWSASHPNVFLPHSKRHAYTNECLCDRLNGSFPIHSDQSIINAPANACQTFSSTQTYSFIRYVCYFYRATDGEEQRSCWFIYGLSKPTTVLGKKGYVVRVKDTTHFIDTLWDDAAFSAYHISPTIPAQFFSDGRRLVDAGMNQCSYHFEMMRQQGDHLFELCIHHGKRYLSPYYAHRYGYNGIEIRNIEQILHEMYKIHPRPFKINMGMVTDSLSGPPIYPVSMMS